MRIIGSERMLDISIVCNENNNFIETYRKNRKITLFSSGRSAIFFLFNEIIKHSNILFPDLYCNEMLNPIKLTDNNIYFYSIGNNLNADIKNIKKNIDAIFIVDYYGYRDYKLIEYAKKQKLIIIIDRTHSLFNDFSFTADYEIGSFRKLFPVSDGGFLLCDNDYSDRLTNTHSAFSNLKTYSKLMRYVYEKYNNNKIIEDYYVNYSIESEKMIEIDNNTVSALSLSIINNYNIENAKSKRKNNFNTLYSELKEYAIINDCDSIYQSFPIRIENRDKIKEYLQNYDIYIPVLWRCKNTISKYLLNIPIDEEYSIKDMKRIIKFIKKAINENT